MDPDWPRSALQEARQATSSRGSHAHAALATPPRLPGHAPGLLSALRAPPLAAAAVSRRLCGHSGAVRPAGSMSSDPPPPYPGGPSAPLLEEKDGAPFPAGGVSPSMVQPQMQPQMQPPGVSQPPSEYGPPPYEPPPHPGFIPMPPDGSVPYMPPGGYYMPPGPHTAAGYYPPTGPYPPPGSQTATVLVPSGAATTVTVLQGEIFQAAPVPTVCPHCQQAITTKISHEIGFMSFLVGFFCCFVGCDLGCCLIPCLLDDFKDVTHTCPHCKGYIYTYKRMC